VLKRRPWGTVVLGVEQQSSNVVWRGSEKRCTEGDCLSSVTDSDRFGCRGLGREYNSIAGPLFELKLEGCVAGLLIGVDTDFGALIQGAGGFWAASFSGAEYVTGSRFLFDSLFVEGLVRGSAVNFVVMWWSSNDTTCAVVPLDLGRLVFNSAFLLPTIRSWISF